MKGCTLFYQESPCPFPSVKYKIRAMTAGARKRTRNCLLYTSNIRHRYVHYFPVLLCLPGDVRVLYVHEIALIKSAHFAENVCADDKETAGTKINYLRLRQILILHQIVPLQMCIRDSSSAMEM